MEIVTLVLAGLACVLILANLLRRPRGLSGEDLEKVRQDLLAEIRQTRQELSGSVASGLQASNVQTEQKLESIRTTMEVRLNAMQAVTDRRLGEMRQTVDEKLQKTLEDRLQKSFGLVSQQLELVYKGLGEMRTLAAGVGDLKKVLSNVKTRGILGEVQLGAILEQILSPGQYAENVATVPGSAERVQREYKIVVAGPTTMAALLNSLQMGFKTLAIQKRSSEVWKVLGSVKAEFDTFGQALSQAQNRLNQASSELENLVGVRTRQIQRKLQQVTLLPGEEETSGEQNSGY